MLLKAPDWRSLRNLAESKVYKLTALFPVVGYVILFYPAVRDFTAHLQPEGVFPLINSTFRLYFFYYSLLLIGLSSLVMLKMPQMFRIYKTADEYADARAADSSSRRTEFVEECRLLSASIEDLEHVEQGEKLLLEKELETPSVGSLRQLYITYYAINSYLLPNIRMLILILFGAGMILLSFLSLDTAAAVGERLFLDLRAFL